MSLTPADYDTADNLVEAAREIIRSQGDRCIIGITQLLEDLSCKFGDWFHFSLNMHQLVDLIETLWEDPHIDQVPDTGWIEFAWNESGR